MTQFEMEVIKLLNRIREVTKNDYKRGLVKWTGTDTVINRPEGVRG